MVVAKQSTTIAAVLVIAAILLCSSPCYQAGNSSLRLRAVLSLRGFLYHGEMPHAVRIQRIQN
ncbi:hypothetical protein Zm00014a_029447 [Zea mays]|uniref:Uncharacterized protein n=1 Tax=Zea mays TaxID=4577 RepID=A0A3L6G1F2_MAIZE|nr:hypothetical protein Zm00014a_029447 [Zea mays]